MSDDEDPKPATRVEAEALFDAFFKGKAKILDYFDAGDSEHWDYELANETHYCWHANTSHDELYYGDEPGDTYGDLWEYSASIQGGIYRTQDFTLVLVDLGMGAGTTAMILDNTRELSATDSSEV